MAPEKDATASATKGGFPLTAVRGSFGGTLFEFPSAGNYPAPHQKHNHVIQLHGKTSGEGGIADG
jgi:hypothetical protein